MIDKGQVNRKLERDSHGVPWPGREHKAQDNLPWPTYPNEGTPETKAVSGNLLEALENLHAIIGEGLIEDAYALALTTGYTEDDLRGLHKAAGDALAAARGEG